MNKLNSPLILKLNSHWVPLGFGTVRKVIPDMAAGAVKGLHISFEKGDDGEYNWDGPSEVYPVDWENWIDLEIREYDDVIHTVNREIRIPRIVICQDFSQMPVIRPKLTKMAILERDNWTCSYTGKKFTRETARQHLNIDHVIPRAQGGQTQWDNVVACCKDLNVQKADKTPEQAGLRLLKKPTQPPNKPISATVYSNIDNAHEQFAWILKNN